MESLFHEIDILTWFLNLIFEIDFLTWFFNLIFCVFQTWFLQATQAVKVKFEKDKKS